MTIRRKAEVKKQQTGGLSPQMTIKRKDGTFTMAKRKSKGKRHCIRTKMTRKGRRCAAYAPKRGRATKRGSEFTDARSGLSATALSTAGLSGDLGRVARVITIPGKGIRCQNERGKFTRCLAGDLGDLGDLGRVRPRSAARRTARRTTRRVSSRGLGEYIPGKGYRCRAATGQFTKCR